ncbi:hypothetical protein BDI4_10052 [Burkholderia diffusa]|nr:hypothetical protein BDI4_10052 [Burkholderia diffusa]
MDSPYRIVFGALRLRLPDIASAEIIRPPRQLIHATATPGSNGQGHHAFINQECIV